MKAFKYATEEAINMQLYKYQITQFDELDILELTSFFEKDYPCNIYFICSRPRIIIDADYLIRSEDVIELKFKAQQGCDFRDHFIAYNLPKGYRKGKIEIESGYPYNYFKLKDEEGIILEGKSAYVLEFFRDCLIDKQFLDYKILYIGQSVDDSETIPTIKRIKKHETLQQIYSNASSKFPDREIYLLLASFKQHNYIERKSDTILSLEQENLDELKFRNLSCEPSRFTEAQRTTFTEAALIRYFEPEYNKEYKHNFPNKKHKSYSECYESDINLIMFELDFSEIKSNIYSDSVEKLNYHCGKFYLHDPEERRKMFFD